MSPAVGMLRQEENCEFEDSLASVSKYQASQGYHSEIMLLKSLREKLCWLMHCLHISLVSPGI